MKDRTNYYSSVQWNYYPTYWVCLPICFVISTRAQLWFKILNIVVERLCDLYFCLEIRATCRHQMQWKNLLRTDSKSFILILVNIFLCHAGFLCWLFSVFGEAWSSVGSKQWEFKASNHQQNAWMHPWVELETNPSANSYNLFWMNISIKKNNKIQLVVYFRYYILYMGL